MMTSGQGSDRTRRNFLSYIDRTRNYYKALGYKKAYEWAYFDEVPFARLEKPLSECRLALVTTASPWQERGSSEAPVQKQIWSGLVTDPPKRLYTADLAWDKEATHTDDRETFLPVDRAAEFVASGRIGSLAVHFHGVPTEYSQRRTIERDAPEILRRCRSDGVDIAFLVPL